MSPLSDQEVDNNLFHAYKRIYIEKLKEVKCSKEDPPCITLLVGHVTCCWYLHAMVTSGTKATSYMAHFPLKHCMIAK